jgi:signal peptidase II
MRFRFLLIAVLWFMLDQVTKWWILDVVMNPPKIREITSFFNIALGWNTGVSFGFLQGFDLPSWVLASFSIIVSAALLFWLARTKHRLSQLALALIVGGALANSYDRLRHGAVIDFLDFHLGNWHWPAFNFADVGIVCGTSLLILHALTSRNSVDAGNVG